MPDVAPDWYDDPGGSGDERWWDGQSWTTQRRPKTPTPAIPTPTGPTPVNNATGPTVGGIASTALPSITKAANWYADPDGSGGQRWWDGHVWTDHRRPAPQPWATTAGARAGISRQNRVLIGAGAAIVLIVAVFSVFALRSTEEDVAKRRCKDSVLNQLATPSTTKFIGDATVVSSGLNSFEMIDANVNFGGDIDESQITAVWKVSGSFDTQNRSGAMVRGDYTCKAVFAGDTFLATVTSAKVR